MLKRVLLTLILMTAVGSIVAATWIGSQKSAQRGSAVGQRTRGRTTAGRTTQRGRAVAPPFRPADPNRAPARLVDDALYTNEEFFGTRASVARPYADALARLSSLIERYPRDATLRLRASALAESLGRYDRATAEMVAYADLKKRSSNSLRRLADYYHHRAMFGEEVRTLQELARTLRVDERGPVYKRAAKTVRSYKVSGFNPSQFFGELVAADPTNVQPIKEYVEELVLEDQERQALATLDQHQARFPEELAYFLKTRAEINETIADRRAAEQVYDSVFDPLWPRTIAADYYDLLRRFGRYRITRRSLQERVRGGATDLATVGRLFSVFSYEGNYSQAARVLDQLEARRAGNFQTSGQSAAGQPARQPADPQIAVARGWNAKELETVAAMFASIGSYDQASRYLYTLYLSGGLQPGTVNREDTLYRLFKVLLEAAGTRTRLAGGDLSFYRDVAESDQNPGFLNGILSLILSGTNIPEEFANEERAAAGYFNRAISHRIFTAFKQEYPSSQHLGEMYLGIVNAFSSLGEYNLAIAAGREFQERFPDSRSYSDVSLRIADCYVALKDRAGERKVLGALLDKLAASKRPGAALVPVSNRRWRFGATPALSRLVDRIKYNIEAYSDTYDPTEGSSGGSDEESSDDGESEDTDSEESSRVDESDDSSSSGPQVPTYSSVLERYVSSLAAEEKKTETVAFFWGEIKKHPGEEGLYERFLQWLGQAQLINEQLKAYNSAVREFDSNTWYHRMARWYVRQKRGRELNAYAKKLIDVFDEDEITDYLYRFAGYGNTAQGDGLDWDERFAYDLYSYSHTRFPRNLFFVRGMLTYLAKHDRPRWERLSSEYYFADRSIREAYLEWLSSKGQLRPRYAEAKRRGGDPPTVGNTQLPYAVFAADTALWLSHHDEALEAYRRMAAIYPGDRQYAERLADLTRSFGQTSDKLFEESASLYSRLADLYVLEHDYRIKAGEVYAQLGDFKRAGEEWDKLIKVEPGERNTYLEVATVYWDYYQYDQAIRVFKDLRNQTGDETIYAYRLGAVYEGKGDIDSAIAEYVKVLAEPGDGRQTASQRLAQLARRPNVADRITRAYQAARTADPTDWELILGYAQYQIEREQTADALAMLRTEVSRATDVAFVETVRSLFRAILRPEDEQQAITRLAEIARDEREAMMYRLQLAAFLERRGQKDQSLSLIDKLVADYPTNVGVVEESSQFYWRAGQMDRSIDLYKRTIARAVGANKRGFTLKLARMQAEANKLADAEATLRAVYNEDRSDPQAFAELARVLGASNKLDDLAALYQDAVRQVREGLGGDDSNDRIVDLRLGMIKAVDALGKYDAAVDQYIEIINLYPEDRDRLRTTMEYAEQHGLVQRVVSYYEKLSRESNKNFRWQLVLGWIYERQGNLAGAADQYRVAVVNEPQRPDLRFNLASVFTRQRRYDEAIAVLREGWTLSGRDPQWLMEIAQIQSRQGQRDEAIKTVRQALTSKQNANTEAKLRIAITLTSWGLDDEAVRVYEETFGALPRTLKDEYVNTSQIASYVRALVRTEPVARGYQKIERMRGVFLAIGDNSQDSDGYKAKNIVTALDAALREDFGRGVIEYASAPEAAEFGSLLQASVAKVGSYTDAFTLKRYLGIARGAGLVDLEEQIQTRSKDLAWDARPKNSPTVTNQDNQFYNELRTLVQFYERHVRYDRAAEVLAAEQRRDPYKNRFDYDTKIADEYRLAGNTQRELEALRRAYSGASGNLTTSQNDWVERYLSLLYATGNRSELQRIASLYNPHQLQLINFLIDKKEKLLALDAIERTRQSPAWIASRSAEVGLFLKDSSPEVEPLFKAALGWKQIGELLGRKAPAGRELLGDEWYLASRNYGYWLGMVGRENDSRRFITGEIESHPSDSRAQIELAAYYLDNRNVARAAEHVQLAGEWEPNSTTVKVLRGRVALANRDTKAALDAWNSILKTASPSSDAEVYLKVMASNGFLRESLRPVGDYMTGYINRAYRTGSGASQVESLKPLIREIAERGVARSGTDTSVAGEVAAFFHSMVAAIPADSVVASTLIDEGLLPEVALAPIYRAIHQRLADSGARVFGTERYDSGYYDGNTWVYPARELADWRRKLVDYLIRQGSFDEAKLLIATIEREQREIELARPPGADADSYSYENRYEWLPLASALIQLRSGRDPQTAIAELRRYAGMEARQEAGEPVDEARIRQRALQAYALLVAERRETDADAFLYEAYRTAVRGSGADDAGFAGLAEIEARRGRQDEAARLLKMMAERSTDNLRALALAAETSARINRLDDAIDYREQLSKANPNDTSNRLELIRLLAANRRGGEAIDRLAILIDERASGNTVRAQAGEVAGEIVRTDRGLAARASEVFGARSSDGARLALSAVREAAGDANGAREVLSRINTGSLAAIAQFKLGLLALAERRDPDAVAGFEKAVQLDSDGRITDSISFRAAGPRAQLVLLYARTGRDAAAFSLAEGDDSQRDSMVSTVVRTALGVRDASSANQNYVFEPGLGEVRGGSAFKTLAELNQAAITRARSDILASLVESAVRLDRYDRAIALARARSNEAGRGDKTALEKRLAEILAADQARKLRIAAQVRFDQSGATQSVYSARATGY